MTKIASFHYRIVHLMNLKVKESPPTALFCSSSGEQSAIALCINESNKVNDMNHVCHFLCTQMEAVWITRGDYFLYGATRYYCMASSLRRQSREHHFFSIGN